MTNPVPRLLVFTAVLFLGLSLIGAHASARTSIGNDRLEHCQTAPDSWFSGGAVYQAAIGRSCLFRDTVALPSGHLYRAISLSTTTEASGKTKIRRSTLELIDPASSSTNRSVFTTGAPVGATQAPASDGARARAVYIVDEDGVPIDDPQFPVFGGSSFGHPEPSQLELTHLSLTEGRQTVVVEGRLPALCRSCQRQVSLENFRGEPAASGRFGAHRGFVNFRLVVGSSSVKPESILKLSTDATADVALLDAAGHQHVLRDEPVGTGTRVWIRRTPQGLRAKVLRPRAVDAHLTLTLPREPALVTIHTANLAGCTRAAGCLGSGTSSEQLVLDPTVIRTGDGYRARLDWFRGLLPGTGTSEQICVTYWNLAEPGSCGVIETVRYGRGPAEQSVTEPLPGS